MSFFWLFVILAVIFYVFHKSEKCKKSNGGSSVVWPIIKFLMKGAFIIVILLIGFLYLIVTNH